MQNANRIREGQAGNRNRLEIAWKSFGNRGEIELDQRCRSVKQIIARDHRFQAKKVSRKMIFLSACVAQLMFSQLKWQSEFSIKLFLKLFPPLNWRFSKGDCARGGIRAAKALLAQYAQSITLNSKLLNATERPTAEPYPTSLPGGLPGKLPEQGNLQLTADGIRSVCGALTDRDANELCEKGAICMFGDVWHSSHTRDRYSEEYLEYLDSKSWKIVAGCPAHSPAE